MLAGVSFWFACYLFCVAGCDCYLVGWFDLQFVLSGGLVWFAHLGLAGFDLLVVGCCVGLVYVFRTCLFLFGSVVCLFCLML